MTNKIKIFHLAFLLIFLAGSVLSSFSQQVLWANKNNQGKRTDFTKVVGQNRFGVFVLKHKSSNFRRYFILEHFDRKMNLLRSKTFRIPDCELEKIVVHQTGISVFTKEYHKGNLIGIKYMTIDSALNESVAQTIGGPFDYNENISSLRIEYNSARDRFMVWYLSESGGSNRLRSILMNRKKVIREGSIPFPYKVSETYVGDALIDDSATLYILMTHSEKFKSKTASEFSHRLLALKKDSSLKNYLINDEKTFVGSYKLCYNALSSTVTAFGLTGESDEDENKGYFSIAVSCLNLEVVSNAFRDFDRKLVSGILGVKNEQKGEMLSKFKIRKLIPRTDGAYMVICERMFVTTQSDIFYVNGIPQSSYARIFNNDEVLVICIDANGDQVWSDIIHKTQSSVNDGGYYNGIVIMVNDDRLDILYNDRLNSNADIIQVTFMPDGTHTKRILINNEQYYALVIPSEYNQVSANSVVIPVNQNREFTYIKLLY